MKGADLYERLLANFSGTTVEDSRMKPSERESGERLSEMEPQGRRTDEDLAGEITDLGVSRMRDLHLLACMSLLLPSNLPFPLLQQKKTIKICKSVGRRR